MPLASDPTNRELALEIDHLHDLLREKEEQLRLQAREYERRLGELNHAHAANEQRNSDFVLKATQEANDRTVSGRISALELGAANLQGRLWALGATSAAIGGLLGFVMSRFWK